MSYPIVAAGALAITHTGKHDMTIKLKHTPTEHTPVLICHGAEGDLSHTFMLSGVEGSPWVNQKVNLVVAAGQASDITAEPELGKALRLESTGAEWKLHCPADSGDGEFDLWVKSEFSAEPYRIPMRLGHYRRQVVSRQPPIGAPVVCDEVSAEVTVVSWYTRQLLKGVEVQWTAEGETHNLPTSEAGVSRFVYTVTQPGEQTITAQVADPYNHALIEETFEMNVYAESPWKLATLRVNGQKIEWNTEILLLRGEDNEVTIEAPPEIADQLQLNLGVSDNLEIGATPDFGTYIDRSNGKFTWTLTPAAGHSGRIELAVLSREIEQHWPLPSWVMSSDLADEVDGIKVEGVDLPAEGTVFFRNEVYTVSVQYKPGSPLASYPLDLKAFAVEGTPVTGVLAKGDNTWFVSASTRSGKFQIELMAFGMNKYVAPVCKAMSRDLSEEIDSVKVDGEDYPANGLTFFRNKPKTITLTYKQHSPVATHPLQLIGTPLTGLDPTHLEVTQPQPQSHSWIVKPHTKSGTFRLELKGTDMTKGIILPACKVLSTNLGDEATVLIGGTAVPADGIFFFRGKSQTLTLVSKADSPLAGHPVTLTCSIKSGLVAANVVSQPAFNTARTTYSWAITGSTRSGTFQLGLTGEGMTTPITVPLSTLVSSVIADEFEPRLNNSPLPTNITLDTQQFALSLVSKNNIPNIPVSLKFISGTDVAKDQFTVTPPFDQNSPDLRWQVVANVHHSATFQLGFQSGLSGMTQALTVPFKLSVTPPEIVFSSQPVSVGSELLAVRGRRHVIRIDAASPVYKGTRVKVELVGDAALGGITPASWLVMDPTAEFVFDASDIKDGEFQLRVTYEPVPTQSVLAKVLLRPALPVIIEVVPDREKFFHNELGYFNVKVAAKSNPDILLKDAVVGATVLGLDITQSHTDEHGRGFILVQLPAGNHVLKAWVKWEGAEFQRYQDVPFIVHNK